MQDALSMRRVALQEALASERRPVSNAWSRWLAPVDAAWLGAFRVCYGLTMFASMIWILVQSLWPEAGSSSWADYHFVQTTFHFKYWGFSWVEAPSRPVLYALFFALAALSLCVAAGFAF